MGASYSIFVYPKKVDNLVYPTERDMLPNRYEDFGSIYSNGKGDYPLSIAFTKLLMQKSGIKDLTKHPLSWIKIEYKDREFILSTLEEIENKAYEDAYESKQYYIDLVKELFNKIESNKDCDFYFKWS